MQCSIASQTELPEVPGAGPDGALLSELRLSRAIIDSAPGVFYLFDASGRFLRWNRNLERVSEYDAEAVARMHPLDFWRSRALVSRPPSRVFSSMALPAWRRRCSRAAGEQFPIAFPGVVPNSKGLHALLVSAWTSQSMSGFRKNSIDIAIVWKR